MDITNHKQQIAMPLPKYMVRVRGILLSVLLIVSILAETSCNANSVGVTMDFSMVPRKAMSPYVAFIDDHFYFTSYYHNLYCYSGESVDLVQSDFHYSDLHTDGVNLYYNDGEAFYKLDLASMEQKVLYSFPAPVSKAWLSDTRLYWISEDAVCSVLLEDHNSSIQSYALGNYTDSYTCLINENKLYMNQSETHLLGCFDLQNNTWQQVSDEPYIASGIVEEQLLGRSTDGIMFLDADSKTLTPFYTEIGSLYPISAFDTVSYFVKSDSSNESYELYALKEEAFQQIATVHSAPSLVSLEAYQVQDTLFFRSFYPQEAVDIDLSGKENDRGHFLYQYAIDPDGTLTLLVKEPLKSPLS